MTPEIIESYRTIFSSGKRSEVVRAGEELLTLLTKHSKRKQTSTLEGIEIPLSLNSQTGFNAAWDDFVADRKERRKALTTRGAKAILDTLAERPQQAANALRQAIKRRWVGFEWEWLDRNGHFPGNGKNRGEYEESRELPAGLVVKIGAKQ